MSSLQEVREIQNSQLLSVYGAKRKGDAVRPAAPGVLLIVDFVR